MSKRAKNRDAPKEVRRWIDLFRNLGEGPPSGLADEAHEAILEALRIERDGPEGILPDNPFFEEAKQRAREFLDGMSLGANMAQEAIQETRRRVGTKLLPWLQVMGPILDQQRRALKMLGSDVYDTPQFNDIEGADLSRYRPICPMCKKPFWQLQSRSKVCSNSDCQEAWAKGRQAKTKRQVRAAERAMKEAKLRADLKELRCEEMFEEIKKMRRKERDETMSQLRKRAAKKSPKPSGGPHQLP